MNPDEEYLYRISIRKRSKSMSVPDSSLAWCRIVMERDEGRAFGSAVFVDFQGEKGYIITVGQHVPRREGEREADYGEDDRYRPSGL